MSQFRTPGLAWYEDDDSPCSHAEQIAIDAALMRRARWFRPVETLPAIRAYRAQGEPHSSAEVATLFYVGMGYGLFLTLAVMGWMFWR